MKTVLISMLVIVSIALSVMAGDAPKAVSVGATSTLILPAVKPMGATDLSVEDDWVTNAYTVGQYVKVDTAALTKYYHCITAGDTATNYPTWGTSDVTSGTAVFSYVVPRVRAVIVNPTANALSFGFEAAAVAGSGITIGQYGNIDEPYLGEIYGIFASTTNDVGVQTFRK